MEPFKITLANSATLTGRIAKPGGASPSPPHCPLVVCLHGGTYTSRYFDVNATYSVSVQSRSLGVPAVAINRPGYADSTSFYPIPEGSSYMEEYGIWLHKYILPALWTEFGKPSNCSSIVLLCHSLGSPGAIVAVGLYGQNPGEAGYPLAGMIISGFGCQLSGLSFAPPPGPDGKPPDTVVLSSELKHRTMMPEGTVDPKIYEYSDELNHGMPIEERTCLREVWAPRWKELAGKVTVPVMVAVAGEDGLWKGTLEHVREFASGFAASERVDGSLVVGAPHNMELSYWAAGWYSRCFGFAVECAVSFAQKK